MTIAFYYLVFLIYTLHIGVDIICLFCTLLDPFLWSVFHSKAQIIDDSESDNTTAPTTKWPRVKLAWEKIIFLYPSLFRDSAANESLILVRYLLYWNACSSIVKFFFLVYPTFTFLILIAVLYMFDCLVYEYEGFTANTLIPQKARLMSFFSLGMSVLSLMMCLWID